MRCSDSQRRLERSRPWRFAVRSWRAGARPTARSLVPNRSRSTRRCSPTRSSPRTTCPPPYVLDEDAEPLGPEIVPEHECDDALKDARAREHRQRHLHGRGPRHHPDEHHLLLPGGRIAGRTRSTTTSSKTAVRPWPRMRACGSPPSRSTSACCPTTRSRWWSCSRAEDGHDRGAEPHRHASRRPHQHDPPRRPAPDRPRGARRGHPRRARQPRSARSGHLTTARDTRGQATRGRARRRPRARGDSRAIAPFGWPARAATTDGAGGACARRARSGPVPRRASRPEPAHPETRRRRSGRASAAVSRASTGGSDTHRSPRRSTPSSSRAGAGATRASLLRCSPSTRARRSRSPAGTRIQSSRSSGPAGGGATPSSRSSRRG